MDCLFCKIADNSIPSNKIYEDDDTLAFFDISPAAPMHALVIPKAHYTSILECDDANILGKLLQTAGLVAKKLELNEAGFRIVINTGDDGGQTVGHLHLHVLGGRSMAWPPG